MLARSITLALTICAICWGCLPSTFGCTENDACRDGDQRGWCEADGYCSFEDPGCPGGRRYGEFAPTSVAGACVPETGTTTGTTATSSQPATTTPPSASTSSSTTLVTGVEEGSSSTTTSGGAASSSGEPPAQCLDWWDCAWAQRLRIRVAQVADAPLSDFPVPVFLDGPLAEAGPDLRFVSSEGTELVHTREGENLAWVFVPTLPASEFEAFAYFDNPDAEAFEAPNPWADYLLVLHGDTAVDASETNEVAESDVGFVDGLVGSAMSFDGDGDVVTFAPNDAVADLAGRGFTASMWVRVDSDPQGEEHPRLLDTADTTAATGGWSVMLSPGAGGPADFLRIDLGRTETERQVHHPSVSLDVWVHLAFTVQDDDVVVALYDGDVVPSSVNVGGSGSPASDAANPLTVGGSAYTDNFDFLGQIDELRVSGVRTQDWLTAEYAVLQPGAVALEEPEFSPLR